MSRDFGWRNLLLIVGLPPLSSAGCQSSAKHYTLTGHVFAKDAAAQLHG